MKRITLAGVGGILILTSCVTSTVNNSDEWSWAFPPTIQFLTQDYRFPQQSYSIGDSLILGFLDRERQLDADPTNRSMMAVVTTDGGDQEVVDLTSRYIPRGSLAVGISGSAVIASAKMDSVIINNGIIEIVHNRESVKVTYRQLLEDNVSELILRDTVNISN